MRTFALKLNLVALSIAWTLAGCASTEPSAPPAEPIDKASTTGPLAKRLSEEFEKHYQAAQGLTYQELQSRYRPSYHPKPSFAVNKAEFYNAFISAFQLPSQAQQKLDQHGFVVLPSPGAAAGSAAGHADLYYRVFANNLPVFISADSILHAWHRTFDKILERTEQQDLHPILTELLQRTVGKLDTGTQSGKDALFYLAVAQALLEPGSTPPAAVAAEVQKYLSLIQGRRVEQVSFMGVDTYIDFSQFIPRGHYTRSEILKQYFMAMMWLGRTDLVLHEASPGATPRPREEAAARALAAAMAESGATAQFEQMNDFYAAFVGRTNALTPTALLELCKQAGSAGCGSASPALVQLYAQQPPPDYSSRVFAGDVPPITMRFFPQRFAYGAWVTSQTTTPRLKPAVQGGRAMAMPEDVAFALGADRAVETFAQDMAKEFRENLPATLHAARQTMASIRPTQLDNTIFNNWLEGLMALSEPGLDPALPEVMRTATWHDRKLEAVLASWTELRHDTILIVEQSTGGIGCQYPRGYVEPVPELYRALDRAAVILADVYSQGSYSLNNVPLCMDHWRDTLKRLISIAEKELQGQPTSAEEMTFLQQTADLHGQSYYGNRIFDGWYPQLYWTPSWQPAQPDKSHIDTFSDHPSGISEPLVADVHTDAENGLALEVATGHPGLMIVAVDNQGDLSLYAGPVASYFSFHAPVSERLTDEAWLARIEQGNLPPRPAFAQSYWAD